MRDRAQAQESRGVQAQPRKEGVAVGVLGVLEEVKRAGLYPGMIVRPFENRRRGEKVEK